MNISEEVNLSLFCIGISFDTFHVAFNNITIAIISNRLLNNPLYYNHNSSIIIYHLVYCFR